jgi:hypothetical protein
MVDGRRPKACLRKAPTVKAGVYFGLNCTGLDWIGLDWTGWDWMVGRQVTGPALSRMSVEWVGDFRAPESGNERVLLCLLS